MQHVIDEIEQYLKSFIEQPNASFGGLPICPFAAKARTEQRIDYQIGPFSLADFQPGTPQMKKIEDLKSQTEFQIVMFVHPDKQAMSVEDVDKVVAHVNGMLNPDMIAFSGHPLDQFSVNGVKIRQDPYPNFQVITLKTLTEARAKIHHTDYYKHYKEPI